VSIASVLWLLQELRQFSGRWKNYLTSFFNYVDLASFCLPLATSLMVIMEHEPPLWLKSFSVLSVWMNMVG